MMDGSTICSRINDSKNINVENMKFTIPFLFYRERKPGTREVGIS